MRAGANQLPGSITRVVILLMAVNLAECTAVDHCYSDIGCFPLSEQFYHPRHRPFNVRPWHRSRIKTRFELYTRERPEGVLLGAREPVALRASGFDPRLETKIIVPGWLDNLRRALWVRRLKEALLWQWRRVNIIVVYWRNFTPYTIATANTRVVGAELANLLGFIERELHYDRSYYHIIGHSLGAHIAGYCGDRLAGLGRITALDPARPFFQHMPRSVRLDRGDARFVDAIHSDFTPENAVLLLMSFGMTTPVGHLDFYPNGPPLLQPGCLRDSLLAVRRGIERGIRHSSLSVAFLEAVRYLTACDHQRSHEWFIESITNRQCVFVGVRCDHFEGLINGRCSCDDSASACAIMGIHADQMYLSGAHEEVWPLRAPLRASAAADPLGELPEDRSQLWRSLARQAELLRRPPAPELEALDELQEDAHFASYLRLELLAAAAHLEPGPSGHPRLVSDLERDTELWYENTSRWYLKTNSRPAYCVNQYQVLVFLGPLLARSGERRLRANLLISIIGSRGQLVNQRFVPRSASLDAFTMQPFFILLEGSYSLGEILSVAVGWEARYEPDPVQATVSFQSNLLADVESVLPSYRARHPWLSETLKYDYTGALRAPGQELLSQLGVHLQRRQDGEPDAGDCRADSLGACDGSRPDPGQGLLSALHHSELEGAVELLEEEASVASLAQLEPPGIPLLQIADHEDPLEQLQASDSKFTAKFHNIAIHQHRDPEDSIVVNRVIISPLQATYGRNGKVGKSFCSPHANFRLQRDQTVKLVPNLVNNCDYRPGSSSTLPRPSLVRRPRPV